MKCPLSRLRCGGCIDLDKAYGQHLKDKHAYVQRFFPTALPVLGMETPLHYRNKVISTFANVRTGLISGIYAQGSHFVLSVEKCHLHDQRLDEIVRIVRPILSSYGIKAFHEDQGTGVLRHLLLRRCHCRWARRPFRARVPGRSQTVRRGRRNPCPCRN